tara:strand:+ start:30693 stop:31211 length:519 start_codon:yes stop_codon:yes gene_type:complete
MTRYIVLLRGINVSGKNRLPMQDLRDILQQLAYQNIQTYIQSGNIILDTDESKSEIIKKIKDGIYQKFEYDVPIIVVTIEELKTAIDNYPFPTENPKIVAFVFLNQQTAVTDFEIKGINEDKFLIKDKMVYIYCPTGFAKTKLSNNLFERKLNVIATTRNFRTVQKLLALSE